MSKTCIMPAVAGVVGVEVRFQTPCKGIFSVWLDRVEEGMVCKAKVVEAEAIAKMAVLIWDSNTVEGTDSSPVKDGELCAE